jgi:hypothetical protein
MYVWFDKQGCLSSHIHKRNLTDINKESHEPGYILIVAAHSPKKFLFCRVSHSSRFAALAAGFIAIHFLRIAVVTE